MTNQDPFSNKDTFHIIVPPAEMKSLVHLQIDEYSDLPDFDETIFPEDAKKRVKDALMKAIYQGLEQDPDN